MRKIISLLFLLIISTKWSVAQNTNGQFIIAADHAKSIIYIDTMKLKKVGTGLLPAGVYHVKAWRLGSELYQKELKIKKDSVTILKIRFKNTKEYSQYLQKMRIFRAKRWAPKLLLLGYFSKLLFDLKQQRDLGEVALMSYDSNYTAYKNANTQIMIDQYKEATTKKYNSYQVIYQEQQKIIKHMKLLPWIAAGLIALDFTYKRPEKFKQEPLLTFRVGSNFYNYYSLQLAYQF